MPSDYAKALGARLRSIRQQQGLSLHGVEQKSKGRWKAVVVGSYERGDRAVTVQRLAELAAFYGVPVAELLPGGSPGGAVEPPPKLVIDLEALQHAPTDKAGPLLRYAAASRGSAATGQRLSIRQKPARLTTSHRASSQELIGWGVLSPVRARPRRSRRGLGMGSATVGLPAEPEQPPDRGCRPRARQHLPAQAGANRGSGSRA